MARVNLDRMMRMLLPYLMRQRMQEKYLESSYGQSEELARLKDTLERERMGISSGYRVKEKNLAAENAIKIELLKLGILSVEELDRPLLELLPRLKEAGVSGLGIPEPVRPEALEEAKRPYGDMMARMSGALEQAKYLPEEEVSPATGLLGSKRVMDFLKQAEKTRAGKEERGLKETGFEVEREKIKFGREKLKAEKVKTPEEKRKELKEKEKRLFSLQEKIAKPEETITPKQIELWKGEAEILKEDIDRLKKETGKKTDEEYRALASELNRRGLATKPGDLDTNRKLRQSLIAQGYNVARLKRFFK